MDVKHHVYLLTLVLGAVSLVLFDAVPADYDLLREVVGKGLLCEAHNRPFSVAIFRVLVIGKSQIAYTLHLDLVIELHCTDSVCTSVFPFTQNTGPTHRGV